MTKPKIDELVKGQETTPTVIPAEAGIQEKQKPLDPGACPGLDPGFAGVTALTSIYEAVKVQINAKSNPKPKWQMFWTLSFDIPLTLGFWILAFILSPGFWLLYSVFFHVESAREMAWLSSPMPQGFVM